ncbi:MAG: hypothetical protein IV100_34135 [Myxococcales bacterium]|nr:hypothetical protein [Myxococcales bacterium]
MSTPLPISLDLVPEAIRRRVGPEAPEPMRMMLARALLPMPPADLFIALVYLGSTTTGELRDTALKSLTDMPKGVVSGLIKDSKVPELLDFAARHYFDDAAHLQTLALNAATPDSTIEWIARRGKGPILELIGNNQARIVRHSALVEAIYFNTDAPMALTTRVFETAVRNGLDLSHIPGYREIVEAIFGREAAQKLAGPDEPLPVEEVPPEEVPPEEKPPEEKKKDAATSEDDDGHPGIADETFEAVMAAVSSDDSTVDLETAEAAMATKQVSKKPLHAIIEEMNVPQKVRLALVGNKGARALLIKDSKLVVCLAVLKSPQVTEGEVAQYAKNKALSERVITMICRNRDWTRAASTQLSLIKHPKTPPTFSIRWVRALSSRDLKELARSRDVPGYIARLAKNLLTQRDQGKKGG